MRLLTAILAFFSVAAAQEAVPLRLQYKAGDKEDLRFDLGMKMELELSGDAVQMKQTMDGKIAFTFRSACKEAADSGLLFESMFTDLDMDQMVTVGDRKVKVLVKDKAVKMEDQDGQVLVDTERNVNPQLAEPVLKEMEGFGETMEIRMDLRGLMKPAPKDKPLPKLLQGMANSGNLFPYVLPDKPVKVGDEWEHVNELTTLGEMKLSGKSIKIPLKYKLERFEGSGATRVAVFSTKVDVELKDIECSGKMSGVGGEISLKIPRMTYKGTGETHFLPATGRAAKSLLDLHLSADMIAEAAELGGKMSMKMGLGIKALVTPGTAKKKDF